MDWYQLSGIQGPTPYAIFLLIILFGLFQGFINRMAWSVTGNRDDKQQRATDRIQTLQYTLATKLLGRPFFCCFTVYSAG